MLGLLTIAAGSSRPPSGGGQGAGGGQGQGQDAGNTGGTTSGGAGNQGSGPANTGGTPSAGGTEGGRPGGIWDFVPQGGSLEPKSDGSYVIRDKDMNVVGTIPAESAKAYILEGQAGSGATAGGPNLAGTIWDQVPPGGTWTPMADGSQVIRDRDGNIVKTIPPGGEGAPSDTGTPPTPPPTPPAGPPPPPVVTPMQGGGTMTSTQNPDGSWSHTYHREDPDGTTVDFEVKPDSDLYPHDDPRFWPPGGGGGPGGRVVTRTPGGGTITSTRNPDGTWTHHYHREGDMGVVDYELKPDDDLYPDDDPRFQNPNAPPGPGATNWGGDVGPERGPAGGGPLARDVSFADAGRGGEERHEGHHPEGYES